MVVQAFVSIFCLDDATSLHFHAAKFNLSCVDQHLLDHSQAEVVVLLISQLLLDQGERLRDFEGQIPCSLETYRVKQDLSDEKRVGYHHGDLPEK